MSDDFLPYGRQQISAADIEAVAGALGDKLITQGPRIVELEQAVCEITGAAHAVAMSSGTAVLHAAAATTGIGPGDVALVPPITFAASSNCIRYVGAEVQFVDIDPVTLNIDVDAAARIAAEDERVKAAVPVSFGGLPVEIAPFREAGLAVIEDAAHALGGRRDGAMIGGPGGADSTCFSLHPVKVITSGEGGILTTEDEAIAGHARRFREHGIDRGPLSAEEPWSYDVTQQGFNYRITDFQSALATSQLTKLVEWVGLRNEIAAAYREALTGDERIELPPAASEGDVHGYHLFAVQIKAGPEARLRAFEGLRAAGIGVQVHYVPTYRFAMYAGWDPADFPNSEHYYWRALSLPVFPSMQPEDVARVVTTLQGLLD